jgi:hypothetical protein
MRTNNQKKEWTTPEIIAIVRRQPEESVLFACKSCTRTCGNEVGPTSDLANS